MLRSSTETEIALRQASRPLFYCGCDLKLTKKARREVEMRRVSLIGLVSVFVFVTLLVIGN